MSIGNVPVGQDAYQAILMQCYAAARNPYVQTSNRYMAGPPGAVLRTESGVFVAMPQMAQRCGRRLGFVPVSGAAVAVVNTGGGGTNYVNGDIVIMAPVNGGRPIVIRIISNTGGNPTSVDVVDPGSGLLGGGTGVSATTAQAAALNQATTTGIGTGATWEAVISCGLSVGANPRAEA